MVYFSSMMEELMEMAIDNLKDFNDLDATVLAAQGMAILEDFEHTAARDWFEGYRGYTNEQIKKEGL